MRGSSIANIEKHAVFSSWIWVTDSSVVYSSVKWPGLRTERNRNVLTLVVENSSTYTEYIVIV